MSKRHLINKGEKSQETIKRDREILREPGQISFKDAMKKAINEKPKKKEK
jgi:hypothetical protein